MLFLSPIHNFLKYLTFCRLMGSKAVPYGETLQSLSAVISDRFLDHCVELAENEVHA